METKYNYLIDTTRILWDIIPEFFDNGQATGEDYESDWEIVREGCKDFFATEHYNEAIKHLRGNEELLEEQGYINPDNFKDNPIACSVAIYFHVMDTVFDNIFNSIFYMRFPNYKHKDKE